MNITQGRLIFHGMWRNFHRMQGGFRRMRRNLQRVWRSFHGMRWNPPRIRRGFYGMRRNSQRMRRSFMEFGEIYCAEWSRKQEHEEAQEHARGQWAKARVPCAVRTADRAPNTPNGGRLARVARLGRSAGASRRGGGAVRTRSDDERQTKERGEKGAATREGVRRFGLHPRRRLPAGPGSRGRRVREKTW